MTIKLIIIKKVNISKNWIEWLNDKDITKFSENRFKKHTKSTQIKFLQKKLKDKNSILFKIFFKNAHIGILELSNINYVHKTCEISYMIGKKLFWNKGIGSSSVSKGLDYAFKKLLMQKICAGTYENNLGSIKVLKNNGFKKEGKIKNFFKFSKSKRVSKIVFGISKS